MPYKDPAKRKEYDKEYDKERYIANPEYFKERYRANPEKFRQRAKEWKETNPEKAKQIQRRADLKCNGWTPERVAQARIEQGDKCAICRETFTTTPHADHKHVTPPEPRALLCGDCNRGLGIFKEHPERLEDAAQYIRDWS